MNNLIDRLLTVGRARSKMNNLIDRRAAIETADVIWTAARELVLERLKDLPSTDAVEVVRCKDCTHSDWYTSIDGKHKCYCMAHSGCGFGEMDFCSYGERKADG